MSESSNDVAKALLTVSKDLSFNHGGPELDVLMCVGGAVQSGNNASITGALDGNPDAEEGDVIHAQSRCGHPRQICAAEILVA
jgi:hypothetical protein